MPTKKPAPAKTRSAKTAPATVAAYLASQPLPIRSLLVKVRAAIRAAVPEVTERMAYGVARYELDGRMLMYFAGWKHHWSLYPAYPSVVKVLRAELAPYEVDKGTIRFPITEPVPTKLVATYAALRAAELRAGTKPAKSKKPTKPTKPNPTTRTKKTANKTKARATKPR